MIWSIYLEIKQHRNYWISPCFHYYRQSYIELTLVSCRISESLLAKLYSAVAAFCNIAMYNPNRAKCQIKWIKNSWQILTQHRRWQTN